MRIYLDLDSRRLLTTPTRPLSLLEFKRRDNDSIELQFLRDAAVQELTAGTTARVGIKPSGDYDAAFLAVATLTQSGTGTATFYSGELNLHTTAMATAFADEPVTLSAMLEVEWVTGDVVSSSKTLPTTIHNDVIRGDEGEPVELPFFYTAATSDFKATQGQAEAGTDNAVWMTPLRTKQAIAALGGSGGGAGPHTHPLADLQQSAATNGQVATWNGTAWVPQTPSGGSGGTPSAHASSHASGGADPITPANIGAATDTHTHAVADVTGLQAALDGKQASGSYAAASHQHDAADISSGTLAIARIPTGTTSTTVCVGNDSRLSDPRTPTSHTHGNLTNVGAIGTTSGRPIITGASGVLQSGAFGTTAGTFAAGNHTHTVLDVTGLQAALDGKQAAGSYAPATGIAPSAIDGTAVITTDSRLSDARTPTAHTHAAADISSGTLAIARIPTGTTSATVCLGNDSRLSDSRTPTSHTHGNITNAGAIGTTSGVPIITGASGALQAGSFGTAAGTFCQGNDSRLINLSGGITAIAVVATMPATPSATTLYIVTT